MRRNIPLLLLLLVMSCAPGVAPEISTTSPVVQDPTTTSAPAIATTAPESQSEARSVLRWVDPETLEGLGPSLEVEGYVEGQAVTLPDGRLVLSSASGHEFGDEWRVVMLDHVDGEALTLPNPTGGWMRTVGYSPALERLVMLGDSVGVSGPEVWLFDPVSMSFEEEPAFDGKQPGWSHSVSLFDEGRKVAFYVPRGYEEGDVGEPPEVWVGDLETGLMTDPVPVPGVVHGHAELADEKVRNPDWPYGTMEPGIVFDATRGLMYAVHGDARAVTVVDLHAARSEIHHLGAPPSLWTSLTSWFIPPAKAKGGEPSAELHAWLDGSGSRLFATGETADAWRDGEGRLHTTHSGLGLLVIDTDSFELARFLDLPISSGLATDSGIAVTGSYGSATWCDEVCKPGNNEPEVTDEEGDNLGLIVLDRESLDVRIGVRDRDWVRPVGAVGDWLLLEGSIGADWGLEFLNMRTGDWGGRLEAPESTFFLVTDQGFLEVEIID